MISEKINKWILTVIQDRESHELMIELPPDLLESTGWKIGDTLYWEPSEEGCATLTKVISDDESTNCK